MKTTSYIEISKSALQNNIKFIKSQLGKTTEICSVVKTNAYGHGFSPYISLAEECGIKIFAVFSAEEAEIVFQLKKPETRLIIMGYVPREALPWVVENNIEFFVFDLEIIYEVIITATRLKKAAKIHIELETGMNRTGFKESSLSKLFYLINNNIDCFEISGICSHLAGAENIANHLRIMKQIANYNKLVKLFINNGIIPVKQHLACSAASMAYPIARLDMARIGIMQYGFWPSRETFIRYISDKEDVDDPLQRILSWKSEVMSIKYVKSGEFISYGTTYLAQEDKKIAIVPVGYGNGYSRSMSNHGRILINGQRVAIIGLVNMNMLIADISYVKNVKIGDEAVLIGEQGDLNISVSSFSEMSDMLNYESLTRLPMNINRIVTD